MTAYHDLSQGAGRLGAGEAPNRDREEREHRDLAATELLLHERLGRLRRPRPGYQARLEATLVARLPEATRPWWRRPIAPASRRNGQAVLTTRRRVLIGLAAAAVGVVAAASLSAPTSQPPEVSAAEILEKAQTLAENPFLAGVKSFHLTARSVAQLSPPGISSTRTIEQWFVAPDRTRMETRFQAPGRSTAISGAVGDGTNIRFYTTPGAETSGPFGPMVMAAPRPAHLDREAGREAANYGVGIVYVAKPAPHAGSSRSHVDGHQDKVMIGMACPEPKRTGETTVAKRAVYIVEADMTACSPLEGSTTIEGKDAELPGLGGRHVTWVDKETFLPLRSEDYAKDGTLRLSYEVTSVEYDVPIPDSIFRDIPPRGTVITESGPLPVPKHLQDHSSESSDQEDEEGLGVELPGRP